MTRRKGEILLVAASLWATILSGCGANQDILKSGKESPTPANVESPKSTIDQEVENMRTADFRFIWIIRRKDGAAIDAGEKGVLRANTVEMNRRVVTDDNTAVIIGSNTAPFKENFDALTASFDVQDVSQEPVPSPLPTREPTPKSTKTKSQSADNKK